MTRNTEEWENAYASDLGADEIASLGLDAGAVSYIDICLLDAARFQWRKVALIVVTVMMALREKDPCWSGVPDSFYAMRVRALVADGQLEAQGDLYRMRFSEVRLPMTAK